jgi:aspartate 1-decarboxylase
MALFKKGAAAGTAKKPSAAPIIVAADLLDDKQKVIYSREQIEEAIIGYAKGKEQEKAGQALMETHKPALGEFARRRFAQLWAVQGARPKSSPKFTTKEDGTGTQIVMSFIDRPTNMSDETFADLAELIGAENAELAVDRFTQYTIDAAIAKREITINGQKATFQEHMEKALLAYFPEEHHESLGAMLKPKEVFQTRKGVIDKALDFVGRTHPKAADRLAEFLVRARIIVAYKPGAVGEDDE